VETTEHPLLDKPTVVVTTDSAPSSPALTKSASAVKVSSTPIDPLSAALSDPLSAGQEHPLSPTPPVIDPLSAGLTSNSTTNDTLPLQRTISSLVREKKDKDYTLRPEDDDITPLSWASKKAGILQKYTTTESISIPCRSMY